MLLKNLWCRWMSLRGGVAAATVSGLLLLAACGGDNGTSVSHDNGISDSEEIQSSSSSQKLSSSSQISSSSSSLKSISSSSKPFSSSSNQISSSSSSLMSVSSSSKQLSSSSCWISGSSSSTLSSSSSSSQMAQSSSSHESSSSNKLYSRYWSWDVPREARLNPEIAYDSIIDSRDGQIYKTVKIGSQVWMAENLNYADSVKTPSLKGKSWCFEKDPEKCAVTGRIYLWAAAIDSMKFATDADNPQDCGYGKICKLSTKEQGICPLGWHLPTKTEWETLFTEVGGLSTVGKMLKSLTGWNFSGNGTDAYGFSALPAGDFDFGDFLCDGNQTFFWSATQGDATSAYSVLLLYEKDRAYFEGYNKRYGHSVRCLKD